jgi:hypothetical protein
MSFHLSLEHRSAIKCVQNDFCDYGTFGAYHAPILHQHLHYLQMERNKIPHDPRYLGVPSGASKMIFEPMVHLVQTVHPSCVKISIISKRTKMGPRNLGVPSGASKPIYVPMFCFAQTVHLSCTDSNTVSKWTKTRFHMIHVT